MGVGEMASPALGLQRGDAPLVGMDRRHDPVGNEMALCLINAHRLRGIERGRCSNVRCGNTPFSSGDGTTSTHLATRLNRNDQAIQRIVVRRR